MAADLSLPPSLPAALRASPRALAFALMMASGFAGLGYQVVWTQQGGLWLGHEAAAVLAVVAAFFGGLAVGSFALGARIERSARPERWYAACEVTIALWSVALALMGASVHRALLAAAGIDASPAWQGCVAFGATFVVLLPATAAMGATLPAMERVLARLPQRGAGIGALYACNTAGAVAGVLVAALWLVPHLGLVRTTAVCAALNLMCAVGALRLPASAAPAAAVPIAGFPRRVLALLACTGALGIGYEMLVVRVLSQLTEDTVYTFALLLAVYLVGTATGAAAWQRRSARDGSARDAGSALLCLQAVACLLGTATLWVGPALKHALTAREGGMAAALAVEAALALLAFGPPTLVMGALFSHLATRARADGIAFSAALGWNTLGAAIAPLLCGVGLAPALGPKGALLVVCTGYLALAWRARGSALFVAGSVAIAAALWAPPLAFVDVPEGGRVVQYREGVLTAVSVVEDAGGVARLRINNRQQEGSSDTLLADGRQALLPMLLHPAPRHALFLGLGTGVTASVAAQEAALQVTAVELLPEVIEVSSRFTHALDAPRLHVVAADARRFVKTTPQRFDVIVADNFHPARNGSGALYTVEHFAAVRERLAERGVFVQWLPLHQLDLDTLRSIVRSFGAVYPQGWAMLATNSLDTPVLGLVARRDAMRWDLHEVRERIAGAALPRPPSDFGVADEFALLGSFVAGPRALAAFADGAALNTDDRPVVAYRAPRITYAPDSSPRQRLLALVQELQIEPAELLDDGSSGPWLERLAAYWRARDRYLDAGRHVQPSADVHAMLAQVREPLLALLRESPDFRPAREPLQRMAAALERSDPAAAQALRAELARSEPPSTGASR